MCRRNHIDRRHGHLAKLNLRTPVPCGFPVSKVSATRGKCQSPPGALFPHRRHRVRSAGRGCASALRLFGGANVSRSSDQPVTINAEVGPDTPLRLDVAVKLAFPVGGMDVAGFRKERDRGNLVVEKIANKEFTTLRHIEAMREKCRVKPREPGFGSNPIPTLQTE